MQRRILLSVAVALSTASGALAQAASTTSNPLNDFIGVANSAVGIINSANAQQTATRSSSSSSSSSSATPPTSTQPAPADSSSTAAPPPHHSNSHRNLIIIIVCCIVGAILIAAILAGVCCCLARRRRRRHRQQTAVPIEDDEKTNFHSPTSPFNPGRNYAPLHPQTHTPIMEQQPTVPVLAATATPGMHQHPAQSPQNPFVPVPPSPRNGIYSHSDTAPQESHTPPAFTTTTTTVTKPYSETQPLRAASRSPSMLPTHPTADRPSTPFGLSGIGRPYEDMHVHVLQTDKPSRELRNSLHNRSPIQHYSTPPLVPSRSPQRHSGAFTPADSSYHSVSDGSSSTGSGSGEEWRRSQQALYPDQQQQRHKHYSEIAAANVLPAPPVPWDKASSRRSSSSPRTSIGAGTPPSPRPQERRASRSPATSINGSGQPRRLRFSDVQTAGAGSGNGNGNGRGSHGHEGWDERRYEPGVGEAL